MIRDGKQVVTHTDHRFLLTNAALGDMITSLPAIIFAMQNVHPQVKLSVYVPVWQIELVRHLLAPYGTIDVRDLNEVPAKADSPERAEWRGDASVSMNGAVQNTHTRNRVHMVDYAFNFLINARPEDMKQRSYPTAALLGSRVLPYPYVVFPVGATSDNKLFHASVMAPIMRWCQENSYAVVIPGTKTSHTNTQVDGQLKPITLRDQVDLLPKELFDACVDMREKTTLMELRDLLGHAAAVVGVDGGTLHLAGTTDVPIVFASGTTLPKHRYIPRHGDSTYRARYVGPRNLECTGCQSNWSLTTWHFTKCPYTERPNACMEMLHPDDFINGLKELGL